MATQLAGDEAAKIERTATVTPPAAVTTPPPESNPEKLPPLPLKPGTGRDPQDFVRANRIHVKNGSLFVDPYLVIHPRELAPQNETALRAKLNLTYSITNPSFYEAPERSAIAMNLGQLVPLSLAAKRAQLVGQVQQFNQQVNTKTDVALTAQATNKRQPMAAIASDATQSQPDPVGIETSKNGLAIYMLMREKLTQNGYTKKLSDYVTRMNNADQVLSDLADNIGASPQQVREAALNGGIDGVGELLQLDARYIAEVKQLADYAATQDFSHNLVEHWHLGRQLLGVNAPLEKKIAAGIEQRIGSKIGEFRSRIGHHYDVPTPIKEVEQHIADSLKLVEPVQRKLLYALGYEICFSPEMTADDIAFHKGVYGLHRKSANDLRDVRGTYRIYFSGKGDPEGSMRTLVHEVAHNLWPEQFTPAQIARIDQLAASDQQRFAQLNSITRHPEKFDQLTKLHAAFNAGNAQEKKAVSAAADELFGLPVGQLFEYLRDPFELRNLVAYATDTLQVEGDRYNKSGYDSPQERFREVISRFAELSQVRLRGQPQLLNFIAPGLNEMWNTLYIPHLEQVLQKVLKTDVVHTPADKQHPTQIAADGATQPPPQPAPNAPKDPQPLPQEHTPATAADTAPDTKVRNIQLEITPSVLAAKSALASMGVHMSI